MSIETASHLTSTEPIATYRERAPRLRREFRLLPGKVEIIGQAQGNPFRSVVPLENLSPDFGHVWVRGSRSLMAGLTFNLLCIALYFMVSEFDLPLNSPSVTLTAVGAVAALAWTAQSLRRTRLLRFTNTSGIYVLEIFESGPERDRAEAFVDVVAEEIRRTRGLKEANGANAVTSDTINSCQIAR